MTPSYEQLKFPIGKFKYTGIYDTGMRQTLKEKIRQFPGQLKATTAQLTEEHLQTPYRPGGWTARQVIHHIADSHMNSIIRFKLALTESTPTIKGYDEAAWANLRDAGVTPVSVSVQLLEALHRRWTDLLDGFSEQDWHKKVFHPERQEEISLDEFLGLYAWHGEHHLGHLKLVLDGQHA